MTGGPWRGPTPPILPLRAGAPPSGPARAAEARMVAGAILALLAGFLGFLAGAWWGAW